MPHAFPRAGSRRTTLRGDTDFTQTRHLERWDAKKVRFLFSSDARSNLIELAESLSKSAVLKMEFRTFVNAFMRVPAQVIRQGRRIVFRLPA